MSNIWALTSVDQMRPSSHNLKFGQNLQDPENKEYKNTLFIES